MSFSRSDHVLQTPIQGWMMAIVSHSIEKNQSFHLDVLHEVFSSTCWMLLLFYFLLQVMALLSGFAGVYTEVS